jgi:hypothetical protein
MVSWFLRLVARKLAIVLLSDLNMNSLAGQKLFNLLGNDVATSFGRILPAGERRKFESSLNLSDTSLKSQTHLLVTILKYTHHW